MTDEVLYAAEADGVAEVRLNRPAKKNALTRAMYTALAEAFVEAEADEAVRAVLITADGDAFTAGNDLADFLDAPPPQGEAAPVVRFMRAVAGAEKPLVAAVNGAAVGIGTTLLLHCDLVVASETARFQTPFVDLGLVPELASSLLLPALVGPRAAAEMLLLGETLDAATALRLGLVGRVVAPEALAETARGLARRLAAKPPEAVRLSKRLTRPDPAAVLARIDEENRLFAERLQSAEARAAFTAFLEKRRPPPAA